MWQFFSSNDELVVMLWSRITTIIKTYTWLLDSTDIHLWDKNVLCVLFFIWIHSKMPRKLIIICTIIKFIHNSFMAFDSDITDIYDAFNLTSFPNRSDFRLYPRCWIVSFHGLSFGRQLFLFSSLLFFYSWYGRSTPWHMLSLRRILLCLGRVVVRWEEVSLEDLLGFMRGKALLKNLLRELWLVEQCASNDLHHFSLQISHVLYAEATQVDFHLFATDRRCWSHGITNEKGQALYFASLGVACKHIHWASE